MKNKTKILKISLSVFVVSALILSALFISDRNRRYDFAEKNTFAMGTILTQKIYSDKAGGHISHITSIVDSLEDIISWRESGSPVAKINKGEKTENAVLANILSDCKKLSEESGGAFDVTVGNLSRLWSIGEDGERIPSEEEIKEELKNVGYENINIENGRISLSSECSIDLGAVGKGLACDYIADYLKVCDDVKGAVVSVGGSNFAFGSYNKAGDKWRIAIRHPRSNDFLGVLSISEGFVSTSGDYERFFEKDSVRYHHILNAKTGYPASSGLISVTVICNSGLLSDALSTACFILGENESRELLEKYNASAVFVNSDMEVSVVGEVDFEVL